MVPRGRRVAFSRLLWDGAVVASAAGEPANQVQRVPAHLEAVGGIQDQGECAPCDAIEVRLVAPGAIASRVFCGRQLVQSGLRS